MTPQSFDVLEYDALKELLAGRTQTPMGKSRARQLTPSVQRGVILEHLKRTSECLRFLQCQGELGLGGLADPGEIFQRLKIRETRLESEQILALIRLIEAGQSLRRQFAEVETGYPHLMKVIRTLPDLQPLLRNLGGKILPDGRLNENACPELKDIRQRIQRLRTRLQTRLQGILRRTPDLVQDEIVTIRNERFVIPIRVEHKGHIAGVIHAASSSGATVFVEPLETIQLNNELVELGEEEQVEVRRILLALSDRLRAQLGALQSLVEVVTEMDLIGAKARLATEFRGCEPVLSDGLELKLTEVRHLLLEEGLRRREGTAVPISLHLDRDHTVMVISGPNAGGKTVALKTIGLCALMAQSGLHVPAREARLPLFHQVLADIGDQQSIVANLSTFTAHIKNVQQMAEMLQPPALVLLDEVGTGTDPEEGAALAVAMVDFFKRRGALVIATTHYQGLKMYAQLTSGVINASAELDQEKLRPTYRLIQGLAGSSSGLEIARRMGLSPGVLQQARRRLKSQDQAAADYLARLKAEFERQQALGAALEEERQALIEKSAALEQESVRRERAHQAAFEARLKDVVSDFSQRAGEMLAQLRDRKEQLRLRRTLDRQMTRLTAGVRQRVKSETRRSPDAGEEPAGRQIDLRVGGAVRLLDINKTGTIASLDRDEVVVEIGPLRFKTPRSNVAPVTDPLPRLPAPESRSAGITVELTPKPELQPDLNLIGCTVPEALDRADEFLDQACLASLPTVRIIHGAGTGALRRAIRSLLATHPHVSSFRSGEETAPGAGGVTIVELRRD